MRPAPLLCRTCRVMQLVAVLLFQKLHLLRGHPDNLAVALDNHRQAAQPMLADRLVYSTPDRLVDQLAIAEDGIDILLGLTCLDHRIFGAQPRVPDHESME